MFPWESVSWTVPKRPARGPPTAFLGAFVGSVAELDEILENISLDGRGGMLGTRLILVRKLGVRAGWPY